MPDSAEVRLVQLPGRTLRHREPALTTMASLVAEIGARIAADADRPMVFYGHSMGGLVAFEVIRWLRAAKASLPRILFVGARRAPHLPSPPQTTGCLTDSEFLERMVEWGSLPAALAGNVQAARMVLPAIRADIQVLEQYRYRDELPLPLPITAFAGLNDHAVSVTDLAAWRRHSAADFRLVTVPGSHFFAAENHALVTRLIGEQLSRG